MSFGQIFDAVSEKEKPHTGDLVLFQIEGGQWTAARVPNMAQVLYGENYEDLVEKALEYAADYSARGRAVSIYREVDANKEEYVKVL